MKHLTNFYGVLLIILLSSTILFAQPAVGDYMSAADGNWSAPATWVVWTGSAWAPAATPPTGTEGITIVHAVSGDVAISISGYVKVTAGAFTLGTGSIVFNDGSTYEHAINSGSMPVATWNTGSTCLMTGITGQVPSNSNQNFYDFIWNCPLQTSNLEVRWSGNTIGGDVTCVSTGAGTSQFRFTSSGSYTDSITILGDVNVQSGTLASTGSSTTMTYLIIIHGDINVTGGTLRLTAASGATVNWRLLGDLNVTNAELRTSGTTSNFIFDGVAAADTQRIALSGVTYTGSWDYTIGSNALVRIVNGPDSIDVVAKQNFINGGSLIADGWVQFQNGSNYQHIINSGTVPNGIWETGSTATFTGVTSQAPANRNQSYYNIVWNCPNQSSNLNMQFDEVTIGGDINILSTGASSRWYLCAPLSPPQDSVSVVTINGNITQSAGQFSSQGTGNGHTYVYITVNGNITVTNGNFACTRGSQGGTGVTIWYLYGQNFSMTDATTQNSNSAGAKFLFSGTAQQNLSLTDVTFSSGFPVEVASNAILDVGLTQLKSSGIFTLNDGATLQTANVGGLDSLLQTTGTKTLSTAAKYTYNGTDAQITGILLPSTVNGLTVNNSAGVTLSGDVTVNGTLAVNNGDLHLDGKTITLGTDAMLVETTGNTVTDITGKIITTRNINAPAGLNVGGMGAMITSVSDLGSTTIERYHFASSQDGNPGINRVFNILPTNNSGLNATLRFYYDESELNSLTEANLVFFKSPDGAVNSWNLQGGTVNATDNYIELSSIGDFSYWTLAEGVTTTFQLSVNVADGWNMVSIPGLHPTDQNVSTWWAFRDPGANVFRYAGGYQPVAVATPGIGYWMKHAGALTYNTGEEWPAGGIQTVAHDPLAGASGWNLIGGYELSVGAAGVTTNPPGLQSGPIYAYSGGYQVATTLNPGYGYWIKLNAAGQIIIPETMLKGEAVEYFAEDWGRIIFTDATGINYTLYAVKGEVDLTQYELPPAPPTGMFDIRFSSGRIAENINSSVKTIDMSGVTYPLTVRAEGMDIRLQDVTGKNINVNLKSGEDVVINDATIQKLMVTAELVPTEYALEQNYPNPFNPSTVIEFSLPEDVGNVKLSIYNTLGEKVAEIVNTALVAGKYSYTWNAQNIATGMYIYELRTDNFVTVKKMLLLK